MDNEKEEIVTLDEAAVLLKMSRETLIGYIKNKKAPNFNPPETNGLKTETGMFVTLHKNGHLRGCIGYIIGKDPLWKAVTELTVSSAVKDTRFRPVQESELEDIDIEISVLTPPEKISDPQTIEMGIHGVIVKKEFNQGVFLPQVATETGWDRETFMNELCSQKAGLPEDAWKKNDVEIFIFTASVYSEADPKIAAKLKGLK